MEPYLYIFAGLVVIVMMLRRYVQQLYPDRAPDLYHQESEYADYVIKSCPSLTKPLGITWFFRSGHIQTVLPSILPKKKFKFVRQYIDLPDGGACALDFGVMPEANLNPHSPVLLILPGLTGNCEDNGNICELSMRKGFRCVFFNKRGHGNSRLLTPKMQSFGDPEDVRQVVMYLRKQYPNTTLSAIGYSAGSGLLVSYVGVYKDASDIDVAVGVSPGYDADDLFRGGMQPFYEKMLLRSLRNLVKKHRGILSQAVNVDDALKSKRLSEFEEKFYCRLYRYKTIDEYWKNNNPMRDIMEINIPCICFSSLDDPVCQRHLIPFDLFRRKQNFMLAATSLGGHCGFLRGLRLEPWVDIASLEFIQAALAYHGKHLS